MLGLFATLNLGARSLQAQHAGVQTAGQNLANVNNPAYARQRIVIQPSTTIDGSLGPQGTGVDATAIQQLRSALVDQQISTETSVGGFLDAQQSALQYAQASLGESIDRTAADSGGTTSAAGLARDLDGLFASFQSVATTPTDIGERQVLVSTAQTLAGKLNQASSRLSALHDTLDTSLSSDVTAANKLITEIADLNDRVINAENATGSTANDLRDMRQAKLEELAKLVNVDAAPGPNGALNLSINGNQIVSDRNVVEKLETYASPDGSLLVRTAGEKTPLALTGGHMQGTIDARDGALTTLGTRLDALASALITEVNTAHAGGFGLNGSTGAPFFTGTDARSIAVNSALAADPSLVQLSGATGSAGNNQAGLALAALADKKLDVLGGATFSQHYGGTVAGLGQALQSTNDKAADQAVVQKLLLQQRDSVSGVSIDEEMTDLMKYQKAFDASAKLIGTVDEMLDTVLNMKR